MGVSYERGTLVPVGGEADRNALSTENQGQNLAVTVLHVPNSLDSGTQSVPSVAHKSRPDSGLGFQGKVLKTFEGVPSSLGSGPVVSLTETDFT